MKVEGGRSSARAMHSRSESAKACSSAWKERIRGRLSERMGGRTADSDEVRVGHLLMLTASRGSGFLEEPAEECECAGLKPALWAGL